ncbi:flavodoxin domain-containing protein [Acidothermaceae bacterium B102]|nr:flavodoxin domain-containing protein [Acidothermaceae bacterium B102]
MTNQTILVSAASRHGATTEIADAIATVLRDRGHEVVVQEPDQVLSVAEFRVVILGSAVYLGHWLKSASRLVDRCVNDLAGRSVYLFSTGPIGDPPFPSTPPSDLPSLLAKTNAKEHVTFAGRLTPQGLATGERVAVVLSHAQYGDFRDWAEVTAWAGRIGDELEAVPVAAAALSSQHARGHTG